MSNSMIKRYVRAFWIGCLVNVKCPADLVMVRKHNANARETFKNISDRRLWNAIKEVRA